VVIEAQRVGRWTLGTIAVAAVILVAAINSSLPAAVLALPQTARSIVASLMPQGWAFFTKDPRSPNITLFVRGGNGAEWTQAGRTYVSNRAWWGWNRLEKVEAQHLGGMAVLIPVRNWVRCADSNSDCLRAANVFRMPPNEHTSALELSCGTEIGFVSREPWPWAWRTTPDDDEFEASVATARLTC
jgi:antimicrobial peptide system SdpA family protein